MAIATRSSLTTAPKTARIVVELVREYPHGWVCRPLGVQMDVLLADGERRGVATVHLEVSGPAAGSSGVSKPAWLDDARIGEVVTGCAAHLADAAATIPATAASAAPEHLRTAAHHLAAQAAAAAKE